MASKFGVASLLPCRSPFLAGGGRGTTSPGRRSADLQVFRRHAMSLKQWIPLLGLAFLTATVLFPRSTAQAGEVGSGSGYKVLEPIRHGNLTVFPVVSATSHDTHEFLTLDEGVRWARLSSPNTATCRPCCGVVWSDRPMMGLR